MLGLLSAPLLLLVLVLIPITVVMHGLLAKRGMTVVIGLFVLVLFLLSTCLLVDGVVNIAGWLATAEEASRPLRRMMPHLISAAYIVVIYLWPLIEILGGIAGCYVAWASWQGFRDKSLF